MSNEKLKLLEATTELGASNWLSALPIKCQGFYLDKQSFWDALFLRYGLTVPKLPMYCVCGVSYTIEHALSYKRGGFIAIRHNEVRNITGEMLQEVCHDVEIEPRLSNLMGEKFKHKTANMSDDARVDVAARGFWVRGRKAIWI